MRKDKLNILIFNFSGAGIGGSEHSTLAIARELKKREHNIVFASSGGSLVKELEQTGIKHYELPIRRFIPRMLQFSTLSIARLINIVIKEEIDCIHCFQYYNLLTSCVAQIFTGVPCVYSVIGPYNQYRIPDFGGHIIAYCGEFRDQVVKKNPNINADEISIIPKRIDLEKYRPGIEGIRLISQFNLKDNSPKVVMLSRFDEHKIKGISILLDAIPFVIERISEAQIIIVGDGPKFDEIHCRVTELRQRFGNEAVILTGALKEIPEVLNIADLVIGVGRSVLEGMACGKPAIIVGEKGFAGIVQPETLSRLAYFNFAGRNIDTSSHPCRLADAIIRILADTTLSHFLGTFSRRIVEKEFDVKAGVENLEEIYRKVIMSDRSTPKSRPNLLISLASCLASDFLADLYEVLLRVKNGQIKNVLSKLHSN